MPVDGHELLQSPALYQNKGRAETVRPQGCGLSSWKCWKRGRNHWFTDFRVYIGDVGERFRSSGRIRKSFFPFLI